MSILGQQSKGVFRTDNVFTTIAGQTVFTCQYNPTSLDIYKNGIKLNRSQYIANTGTSITIPSTVVGDTIEVITHKADLKYGVFSNTPILVSGVASLVNAQTYVLTGASTLTLPSSPLPNWTIRIINASGAVTSTLIRNGQPIQGISQDLIIDILNSGFTLVYIDNIRGWWLI